jgi:hypothetical protein
MRALRVSLVCLAVAALVVSATALAEGEPQREINPRDEAKARAMLLRSRDLQGYSVPQSTAPAAADVECRALDESDLTITGDAISGSFQRGGVSVASATQVFESAADAGVSWRRRTSAAVDGCLRALLRREMQKNGGKLVSYGQVAFPRLTERTVAGRLVVLIGGLRFETTTVALGHRRAQAFVLLTAARRATPEGELQRLARIVAARMKSTMRGA